MALYPGYNAIAFHQAPFGEAVCCLFNGARMPSTSCVKVLGMADFAGAYPAVQCSSAESNGL